MNYMMGAGWRQHVRGFEGTCQSPVAMQHANDAYGAISALPKTAVCWMPGGQLPTAQALPLLDTGMLSGRPSLQSHNYLPHALGVDAATRCSAKVAVLNSGAWFLPQTPL